MSVRMFLCFSRIFSYHISMIQQEQSADINLNSSHPKNEQIYAVFLSNHAFPSDLSDKFNFIQCTNAICAKENLVCQHILFLAKGFLHCSVFLTTE